MSPEEDGMSDRSTPLNTQEAKRTRFRNFLIATFALTGMAALAPSVRAQEVNVTSGTTNLNALVSFPDFLGIRAANTGVITGSAATLLLQTYQYGAFAQNGGRIDLTNVIVRTNGYAPSNPVAGPRGFAAQGANAVVTADGFTIELSHPTSSAAQNGTGLRAVSGGLVDVSNGSVSMTGQRNYGALAVDGTVRAENVSIETDGGFSYGIFVFPGTVGVQSLVALSGASSIITRGATSHGILSQPGASNLQVGASSVESSADITTYGNNSVGAWSFGGGWIDLTDGSLSTRGASANGINSSGDGSRVWIRDAFTGISTFGDGSHGISVSRTGATGAGGTVFLDSVDIETSGANSNGIDAGVGGRVLPLNGDDPSASPSDTVVVFDGSITANSASSNGIAARADTSLYLETGSGSSVAGGAYGINASNTGTGQTNITTGGLVTGGQAGLGISSVPNISLTNEAAGVIRNRSAQTMDRAIEQVSTGGTDGALIFQNLGLVKGTVFSLDSDDVVQNYGVWNMAGGTSDFGGGQNTILNSVGATFVAGNNGAAAETTELLNIASLSNGGTIRLADGGAGDRFTINGNYIGNNGLITIDTALGSDASPTDMLVIMGDASGSGRIEVKNVGGSGARTVEGIRIVDIAGASDANFTLLGNYSFEGDPAVVGGAYAYRLYKNGLSNPTDGDWYLRSALRPSPPGPGPEPEPIYQPAAPIFEAYPQILLGLNSLPTLQHRLGNRFWSGNGAGVISEGADAIGEQAEIGANAVGEGKGVWGRIEANHARLDPDTTTTRVDFDYNFYRLEAGIDLPLMQSAEGVLIGGISVHYGNADADTSSVFGNGRVEVNGYGGRGTLTWFNPNGLYVDAQASATWYDSDLRSDELGSLVDGNDAFGYALSIEAGQQFELASGLSITPQAQLVYSSVDFDSFEQALDGTNVASVSLLDGESLRGRVGLALDKQSSWQAENGTLSRSQIYGIANLYYEFLDGTVVDVSDVSLANKEDRFWGGLGAGASHNWQDDTYSVYGEALVTTSLENFGDSYELKGTAGFRIRF